MTIIEIMKCFWSIIFREKRRKIFFVTLLQFLAAGAENLMAILIASFASFAVNPNIFLSNEFITKNYAAIFPTEKITVTSVMLLLVVAMILSVLTKAFFNLLAAYSQASLAEAISVDTASATMRSLVQRDYAWHLNQNPADLVLALQWRQFGGGLCTILTQLLFNVFLALMLLSTLCFANPMLLLPMVLVGGAGGGVYKLFKGKVSRCSQEYFKACVTINAIVSSGTYGIREVKVFQAEQQLHEKLVKTLVEAAPYRALQKFYAVCPANVLELLVITFLGGFGLYLVAFSGLGQEAAVGMLSLLAVSGWRMVPAMNRIITGLNSLKQSLPYLETLAKYLKESKHIPDLTTQHAEINTEADITLEKLSFRYSPDNEDVFSGLSINFPKRKLTAVIGDSGVGKSTLLYLLLGLLTATDGKICVAGQTVNRETLQSWMAGVGYVPQSPYLFEGTIAENIAFGVPFSEIDRGMVHKCCKLASCDFVDELVSGLDTLVGERGATLSGGQLQRIAIARALYKQPKVLIFDEATSALDAHNEKVVLQTLFNLRGEMTVIIVTHRLNSLSYCDQVVYMKSDGDVLSGSHEAILKDYMQRNELKNVG